METPKKTWLYRITHIKNLPYIFDNGIYTSKSKKADKDYVKIGDQSLIQYRKDLDAKNPPGGKLSDYIPFYLGQRSPMLFQIATGYEDIEKFPQEDIVYLITSYEKVLENNIEFFFTDSNARTKTCNYYSQKNDFEKLDWGAINSTYWKSDETDLLRKQKKQAEFLIKDHLPVSCIEYIGVYNDIAQQNVSSLLLTANLNIPLKISPHNLYYDNI